MACENLLELYLPGRWVPHITVAMKDLTEENFKRAMDDLSAYRPSYRQTISNLALVQASNQTDRIEIVNQVSLGRGNSHTRMQQ